MNWIAKSTRLAIYLRDGMACCYCGATVEGGAKLTLDHQQCYSKGGTNAPSNLVTCCGRCNSSRGTRDVSEFIAGVSAYTGVAAADIARHVRNCRARVLPRKLAMAIIKSRATWAGAIESASERN